MIPLPALHRVCHRVAPNSRRAVLQTLAKCVAEDLFRHPVGMIETLTAKGHVGVTGAGAGALILDMAVPALETPYLLAAHLVHPILWDAQTTTPIDLIALLVTDEKDQQNHLRLMAGLSRRLHDPAFLAAWRSARSDDAVRAIFAESSEGRVAA